MNREVKKAAAAGSDVSESAAALYFIPADPVFDPAVWPLKAERIMVKREAFYWRVSPHQPIAAAWNKARSINLAFRFKLGSTIDDVRLEIRRRIFAKRAMLETIATFAPCSQSDIANAEQISLFSTPVRQERPGTINLAQTVNPKKKRLTKGKR